MTDETIERVLAGRRLMQALLTEQAVGDDAAMFTLIADATGSTEGILAIGVALKFSVFFNDHLLRLAFPEDEMRTKIRQNWFAQMEADTK